jgi:precorrin-4/cobalt-precorrin-4 C11-methyltransferase
MVAQVYFIGVGPGTPELLTVKGKKLIETSDLLIHYGDATSPEIIQLAKKDVMSSYGKSLEEITDTIAAYVEKGKTVVRLHSGDPAIFGGMLEQIDALEKKGIEVEAVPGVSAMFASTALLKTQLTVPGVTQTVIITRPEEPLEELSKHSATMVIFLGAAKIREIMERVAYPPETDVAVVYHAFWHDQKIIRGTVSDIAGKVEQSGIKHGAIIIIGEAANPKTILTLDRGEPDR